MNGLLLSALISVASTPSHQVTSHISPGPMAGLSSVPSSVVASDWYVSGQVADACKLQVRGLVTDASGADLDLACSQDGAVMGNVSARVAAQGWRQRRITVSAEIKVDEVLNASLWLKTQRGTTALMFDDDSEQNLLNTTRTDDGWERRIITLPIAADATEVSFGVLVQGSGALAVRNMHLRVSRPGSMSTDATQLLDAALAIVKQQTLQRDDLSWRVLEPQVRLFASGAQRAAEVYPAIKYLLSQLGDRRSMLLTSEVAMALNRVSPMSGSDTRAAAITLFALPDGAQLVLTRSSAEPTLRTARTESDTEALP